MVIFGSPSFVKRGATSGPHSGGQLVWLLGMSQQLGTLIHSKHSGQSLLYIVGCVGTESTLECNRFVFQLLTVVCMIAALTGLNATGHLFWFPPPTPNHFIELQYG